VERPFGKARQATQRVKPIVKNLNFQRRFPLAMQANFSDMTVSKLT